MPVSISGDGAITGLELEAFEDVDVGSGASDGDVLTYDASGDLWIPQGIVPIAGIGSNVVQTVKTDTFSTSSTSFVDVMTATITPSSASSRILVIVDFHDGSRGGSNSRNQTVIVRDSTIVYVGDAAGSRSRLLNTQYSAFSDYGFRVTGVFLDSPGTTSATTYRLQTRVSGGGTAYINRGYNDGNNATQARAASSITVVEVAA